VVSHSPEFRSIHQYYTAREKNPLKKMQSLIAVACKLIRYQRSGSGHKQAAGSLMGSDERRSSLFKNSSYCRSLFLIDFQYTILQAVSVPYRSDSRQNPAWSAAWTGHLQHNLMRVEWDNEGGTEMSLRFIHQITEAEAFNTICNLGSMAMTGFYFSND